MAKKKTGRKNKICPAGIAWAKRTLPMQIWQLVNIVKILTTQKKVRNEQDE